MFENSPFSLICFLKISILVKVYKSHDCNKRFRKISILVKMYQNVDFVQNVQ